MREHAHRSFWYPLTARQAYDLRMSRTVDLALACLVLLACGKPEQTKSGAPSSTPPDVDLSSAEAAARADSICERLVAERVARNCRRAGSGSLAATTYFEIVGGFPKDRGEVFVYLQTSEAEKFAADVVPIDADDYPNQRVASVKNRALVQWTTTDLSTDAWDDCRDKRSVSVCAKSYPSEYSRFRVLGDTIRTVLGEPARTPVVTAATVNAPPKPGTAAPPHAPVVAPPPGASGCTCNDGAPGCCGRGCCSHHGGIR